MQMTAITSATLDDGLYITLAEHLLNGDWLGPYNWSTLVKSPFYPMFIAASSALHVPLWLSQHLLHLAACIVMVVALRPWLRNPWLLFAFFVILWLDPRMYDEQALRVAREGIYLSVSLLVIACAAGILFRAQSRLRTLVPWSCGLGISLSAMWLTREEGIWLVPTVLLMLFCAAFRMTRRPGFAYADIVLVSVLPWVMLAAGIAVVSAMNHRHYGVYTVVELKDRPFQEAYGALTRVKHAQWRQYISLPWETRARIYTVSPRFAELAGWLEGPLGAKWGRIGAAMVSPPDEREIAGGWIVWALRDAVMRSGYHDDATKAATFYRTLAEEINRACDSRVLECDPARTSNVDPWRSEYYDLLPDAVWVGIRTLVEYRYDRVAHGPSYGDEKGVALFERIALWEATTLVEHVDPNVPPNEHFQMRVARSIFETYRFVLPAATVVGFVSWLGLLIHGMYRVRITEPIIFTTALCGGILARVLILAYINVTAYHATNILYMAPLYPMLYVFIFVSVLAFQQQLRRRAIHH